MILVTGGTGLVGSHLLFKLTQKGHRVRAIYRTQKKIEAVKHVFSYYTENVEELFSKIEWVEGDITDIPKLTEAFNGITHVYHCAAFISFDPNYYHSLRQINIEGTANVVNLCVSHNIKKLCYVSSIAAIGKELSNKLITEESPWNKDDDHSVYAITKYGAEMEVWRGCQEGLDVVIVNPGVIIGPGFWRFGSGSFFKRIYKGLKYYTKGTTGYVHVNDVVNIMVQLMEGNIKNERYIVIAENLTFQSFFTKIANALNVEPPKKKASSLLLQIAWRMDWLRSKIKGRHRRLVRHSVNSIQSITNYDNSKTKRDLSYEFNSVDSAISSTSRQFLSDQ
ncbi:MAG: NAD-dependent epimerase/dehydratase family protein [Flavobacteriaceae bacterium]|nr:NAD-dependent epimerase/dehydratase family protein [Flavobacteriaceae bacterium]